MNGQIDIILVPVNPVKCRNAAQSKTGLSGKL